MKKIVIAGTSSGVGKTTVSIAIMAALTKRNLRVQPFKVGPDYIDTSYHYLVTGNRSINLDEHLLNNETIKYLFNKNLENSDIAIVEGVMGLFDGYGIDLDFCSTSGMSKILNAPVILVIDGSKLSTSAAAMVLGYKNLDKDMEIGGVIVNNISSEAHYNTIKDAIEKYAAVPVLGYLLKTEAFKVPSRHLGLVPSIEFKSMEREIEKLANSVEETLDLDKILEIAKTQGCEEFTFDTAITAEKYNDLTIAVAYDEAFNFYYWDNIRLIQELGVEIKFFNTMEDEKLPDCDGLIIGGGFPEIYVKELEKNESIMMDIKCKAEEGMPIYAECGGLMYLGEELNIEEKTYKMVGFLKGYSIMTKTLQRFGYCNGEALKETVITKLGEKLVGHEFHHSKFVSKEETAFIYSKVKEGQVISTWEGGYFKNNVFASYMHINFYNNLEVLYKFLNKMKDYKRGIIKWKNLEKLL